MEIRKIFFSFLRSCQYQWNSKFLFFSSVNTASLHFSPNEMYFLVQLNLAFMWCSFHERAFCPFEYWTLRQFFNVLHMGQCETLMSPGSWIWEKDFSGFSNISDNVLFISWTEFFWHLFGCLVLIFLCNYSLHTLICWFSWRFLVENAHLFQKHRPFLSRDL